MRSEGATPQGIVTHVTSDKEPCSVQLVHLRQSRLEGISRRYWTPFETRLQGSVSSRSSTLLPSAGPQPARCQQFSESVTLTPKANSSSIFLVSQTACQYLACNEVLKGSGMTNRSLSTFCLGFIPSNLRLNRSTDCERKLSLPAQEFA
jgi:hypothetical protein